MNQYQTETAIESAGYVGNPVESTDTEITICFASDLDLNIVKDSLIEAGIAEEDIRGTILVKFRRE